MNYSMFHPSIINLSRGTNATSHNDTLDLFNLIWGGRENSIKVWMIFSSIVCVSGTLLNLAILITLITLTKVTYSACRTQMAHLIVIDLVQCMVTIPLDLLVSYYPRLLTPLECGLSRLPFLMIECSANWATLSVAANRFIALVFPTYYRQVCRNKWFNIGSIAGSWIIGFLLISPYLDGYGGYYAMGPPWYRCLFYSTGRFPQGNTIYLGFVMPMTILGVLYVSMGLKMVVPRVWNRQVVDLAVITPSLSHRIEKRLDLARMLFVAAFFYILLYLPNPVLGWFYPWLFVGSPIGRMWLRTVYCVGFLVNPIVFLAMSREYRGELATQWRNLKAFIVRHLCPYHC
ncbi:hypothetical protein BV898_16708 [Hypsibius exemplaris]|uniref:G-protein coupled receptors family 1 profile domain-containing protein n=1 Tax=Hypsibius exemplaris TaxID=2072580 RepID=A0A9X6RLR7_HYPEX|nr:hypothetical protein BV898_16708 [Hypsibius exemplaris]